MEWFWPSNGHPQLDCNSLWILVKCHVRQVERCIASHSNETIIQDAIAWGASRKQWNNVFGEFGPLNQG